MPSMRLSPRVFVDTCKCQKMKINYVLIFIASAFCSASCLQCYLCGGSKIMGNAVACKPSSNGPGTVCQGAKKCSYVSRYGTDLQLDIEKGCLDDSAIEDTMTWCKDYNRHLTSLDKVEEAKQFCYICDKDRCNDLQEINWKMLPLPDPRTKSLTCYKCNTDLPEKDCNMKTETCEISIHACYYKRDGENTAQGCWEKNLFEEETCRQLNVSGDTQFCVTCTAEDDEPCNRIPGLDSSTTDTSDATTMIEATTFRKKKKKGLRCHRCSNNGRNYDSDVPSCDGGHWATEVCRNKFDKCATYHGFRDGSYIHEKKCFPDWNDVCKEERNCRTCTSDLCNSASSLDCSAFKFTVFITGIQALYFL